MTETIVLIKVLHEKPLPELTTDVVSQRTWNWLLNAGVKTEVTATLVQVPKEFEEAK